MGIIQDAIFIIQESMAQSVLLLCPCKDMYFKENTDA